MKNLFDTMKAIITDDRFNAPIDFFGDLEGTKMTSMTDEQHKYASCFEAFRCAYDYSFIESYSSRAGKEWEAMNSCSKNIKDRYLRFATLSCGVNNAIDAAKKNPKKGEMRFETFKTPISVRSDLAKRSGKLGTDGSFNPLFVEATQPICNTSSNSAMGRLAKVLDENTLPEFGLIADQNNRLGGNDTLVDAKDAVKTKDLDFSKICYDVPDAHYVVEYEAYKSFVKAQAATRNEHIARAIALIIKELDNMEEVDKALGIKTIRIIRDAVKLYNAATKDLGNGREYAWRFMICAEQLGTTDDEERITIELVNKSVKYLAAAADKWIDWYGHKYHAVTNMLFNIEDLISLFNGEWVKAYNANTVEAEITEEDWQSSKDEEEVELINDEEFLKLF